MVGVLLISAAVVGVAEPVQAQRPTLSGSVRARVESWSWFESSGDDDYQFVGVLARGAVSQQLARLDWRIELAAPVLLGLPGQSLAPAPQGQLGLGAAYWAANDSVANAGAIFLKQAYVRWRSADTLHRHAVRLGRIEFVDGLETMPAQSALSALKRDRIAHRLIGNFAWSHVQRSFDGLHYTYDGAGANVTLLAVRPVQGVFNTNGWPELKVATVYGSLNSAARAAQRADWRVFGVYYRDDRDDPVPLKTDNRPLAARQADRSDISIGTVGGHYLRLAPMGAATIDALVWGAGQLGSWGTLDHRAYAFSAELGVRPRSAANVWLRAGYTRASGDASPADDEHGTFFQMLPTPRWYARFPFYNLMNTEDRYGAIVVGSSARIQARAELHQLALTDASDLWYAGGGAFEPGSFGFAGRPSNGETGLGRLLDLGIAYRPAKALSLNGYLGWVHGAGIIDRIYPGGHHALLGYLEVEWSR
jgi:hypothetical protein